MKKFAIVLTVLVIISTGIRIGSAIVVMNRTSPTKQEQIIDDQAESDEYPYEDYYYVKDLDKQLRDARSKKD